MKTKTIKQTVIFKANPSEVYEALMDSKKHSKFTESECIISRKVKGKFSVYDGYAEGINLELIKDKKIVQKWHASDWPDGHYSIVTFSLTKFNQGTKLIFTQERVPEKLYKSISEGWHEHYWEKMKNFMNVTSY
ncbi:SRPBCC domain-containing protein [Candidatus Woesearchaeota archaeon]|nr:SRPBCC domain-containing protein [Candidatus Woesearchaeota archaeon]